MKNVDIPYYLWNRFTPNNLFVKEELLGKEYELEFQDSVIRIKFPDITDHKEMNFNSKLTSWQKKAAEGQELKPSFYVVQCLYIFIDDKKSVSLDIEVTKNNANCYEHIPKNKQKILNDLASKGQDKANDFYAYFSSIIRWVMGNHSICRTVKVNQNSDWDPRIFSKETNKTIWIGGERIIKVGIEPVINKEDWAKILELLKQNAEVPIYVKLLDDASYQLSIGDFNRCISDLAVAAETYIRNVVSCTLPKSLAPPYVSILDEYNIRPILTKVLPKVFNDEEQKKLKKINSSLNGLFDKRNSLFHSGLVSELEQAKCEKYLNSVKNLIAIRDL